MTKISVSPASASMDFRSDFEDEDQKKHVEKKVCELVKKFHRQSNLIPKSSWPQGEVKLGQEERYTKWLEERAHDVSILEHELLECAHLNLVRKFQLLARFLQGVGLGINLDIPYTGSCILYATSCQAMQVCEMMVELADRQLLMMRMTKEARYNGVTALHMATVNSMPKIVKLIMDKLCEEDRLTLLNTHLEGHDFIKMMKVTTLPLHLACWVGNIEMYDLLMTYGADPTTPDLIAGNTVFHVLVTLSTSDPDMAKTMFTAVLNSPETHKWFCSKMNIDYSLFTQQDKVELKNYVLSIENADGYTPLTFTAMLGIAPMLDFILNIEGVYRTTLWQFGPQCFALYNLAEIDPVIACKQRPGRPNILELLIYRPMGRKSVGLHCFNIPVIKKLVRMKFKELQGFAILWFTLHFFLMFCCYKVPMDIQFKIYQIKALNQTNSSYLNSTMGAEHISTMGIVKDSLFLKILLSYMAIAISVNMISEILDTSTAVFVILARLTRRWHRFIYKIPFLVALRTDGFRMMLITFSITEIISLTTLIFTTKMSLWSVPAFASGCGFFMFFLQGFHRTGYFNTMLFIVVSFDLLSFTFVFLIMLTAFAGGMMIINATEESYNMEGFDSITDAVYSMFKYMTGFGNAANIDNMQNAFATIVFVAFVCFTMILLMNLLIAAMSETYSHLAEHKDIIWSRNMAAATLLMERWTMNIVAKLRYNNIMHYDAATDKWSFVLETRDPPTCL